MSNENVSEVRSKVMTTKAKYLNISVLLLLLCIAGYIIIRVVLDNGIVLFTYHPTFISLGYLILLSNAILIMADNSFITMNLSHQNRVTAHWIIQSFAVLLILIAQTCIFTNKNNLGKPHFTSTHSIFGLITVLLTISSAFGGIFTKYSFGLRNIVKPIVTKIFHSFFGIVSYVMAIITIILGFNQMWVEDKDSYIKPVLIILLVLCGFYVIIKSVVLLFSRIKDVLNR